MRHSHVVVQEGERKVGSPFEEGGREGDGVKVALLQGVRMASETWKPDAEIADRIRKAYLLALAGHQSARSAFWSEIFPAKQRDIHEALIEGGAPLHALLRSIGGTNLYLGVDDFCLQILDIAKGLDPAPYFYHVSNMLLTLAELLGGERAWNPEGGSRFPQKEARANVPVELLLAGLDRVLAAPVTFPNPFEGEIGLFTDRGIAVSRAVNAIYQAHRMRQFAGVVGGDRCLEIGAGMGRTAFYAWSFGLHDYTIVDLPMTLVGQACFLAATIGPEHIRLFGEAFDSPNGVVRLAPPQGLFSCSEQFDVALNADSLTEMNIADARAYVQFIREQCRSFISINHEANEFAVSDLIPGLIRYQYALRPGYVEELSLRLARGHRI